MFNVGGATYARDGGKRQKKAIFFLREKSAPTAFPSIFVRAMAVASDERWGEVEGLRYETQSSATLVVKTRTDGVGNHAQVSPALPRHCPVAACLQRGQGGLAGLMADGGAC